MFRPLVEVLPNSSAPSLRQNLQSCEPVKAKMFSLNILGSYRNSDVDDPKIYVTNAAAVLCRYPELVAAEVCAPGSGIQARQKWLPTVSELREACEAALAEHQARERRAMLAKHRVLIDTPHGPQPEAEAEKPSQEARDRAVAHWQQAVRPSLQTQEVTADRIGEPPGLTEDERRRWYQHKADAMRARSHEPLPKLSEAALQIMSRASIDRGGYADAAGGHADAAGTLQEAAE
jgi:hypothetical protein